jgi:hypothetical protein
VIAVTILVILEHMTKGKKDIIPIICIFTNTKVLFYGLFVCSKKVNSPTTHLWRRMEREVVAPTHSRPLR